MRRCAICLFVSFILTCPAFAEVRENLEYKYYDVKAEVGDPLRPHIFAASPIKMEGKQYSGVANYNIKWYPRFESDRNGACHITGVSTVLNAVITLPKLIGGDDLQKTNFERYINTLREHELNHYRISMEAAQEIDANLMELPPIYGCGELKALADKIAYSTQDYFEDKQRQYDRSTKHGHKEGAWVH